ncbi:myristylated tegument protein [Ateline alphaherpesvirus 1]|uniref:Myristylated tegument protein n=1 Tax=Herpesvirus ateles type 1 (strain Lennette) TaxID=35243 RepID=A0A1S6JLP8_HSVA1|nr:myristylated tegument protein [Ateline alphaherpesvirus 1]AQS79205.1 myristylated tegument protein [Ateline alphaherpesvirus 1]
MGQAVTRACCRRNTLVTEAGETVSLTEGEFETVDLVDTDGESSPASDRRAQRPRSPVRRPPPRPVPRGGRRKSTGRRGSGLL